MLFITGLFYLNYYVLIPRFFTRRRIGIYIGVVLLALAGIGLQQAQVEVVFIKLLQMRGERPFMVAGRIGEGAMFAVQGRPALAMGGSTHIVHRANVSEDTVTPVQTVHFLRDTLLPPPVLRHGGMRERNIFGMFLFPDIFRKSVTFALLVLVIGGFIKVASEWFRSEQQREALKVANLNAELRFLRSQINPHFLFNSLNTVYSLAHRRSPETEHALVKLSNILRYMIYQSNEDKVLLANEIRYLQDFIDMQRLRLSSQVPVEVEIKGDPAGLRIAPMLLIPFVENAFKHGVSYEEPSWIHIGLEISEGGRLRLRVRNRLLERRVSEKGGVGLGNTLKRLELMYKDAHEITIREQENEFIADLIIALKHDEVHCVG
ncbi:sensor histidine kinase [uncultured Chitinophaga sp.]|uniref:sensor histidine kinase n=1 Tax=uncultured Chitinophaga sp. TaxID=339340 RepID=UPI002633478D|nr:sensor histidine kinase [uncultured Chitinophaga sp.]